FLQAELGRGIVTLVGVCEIDYSGRAESMLAIGERMVLLKPDGTLLVHTPEKLKPVNWQPPGCAHAAAIEDGRLVVTSSRKKPPETVRIVLHEIDTIGVVRLRDDEELLLVGSEDDLQRLLHLRPDLVEPGFRPWARERQSQRGPMDVYGEDARGNRVVVEAKRRAAGMKEVEQLRRYVEKERQAREGKVRGVLVAPSVSDRARRYLAELDLEFKAVDWDAILPAVREVKEAGQTTLGAFAPAAQPVSPKSPSEARARPAADARESA
ncbi:MAG TPA: endonuclease NucS, partial [Candidatus Thermoplasmatota archaeon]|nr:endonuclease NucS [Candidatus Thermoplasmatota archaeon]